MKKLFTPILTLLLATGAASGQEVLKEWDFTKWSEETVTNLKADDESDNSSDTGGMKTWSCWEKATGGRTNDNATAQTDKCYWLPKAGNTTQINADGNLVANGTEIKELKGLNFTGTANDRGLAIAINYPTTSTNSNQDYHGAQYLWLGGTKEYFKIPNVPVGSIITMGVESHKFSDPRGVALSVNGTDLTAPDGSKVSNPTTYAELSWRVPGVEGANPVDVSVSSTNGCHVYFITVEAGEPDKAEDQGTGDAGAFDPSDTDSYLFYADFNTYPAGYENYFNELKTEQADAENPNIIAKASTNVTAEVLGMTFYSGTSGRVVAMSGSNNSDDLSKDYGPNSEADKGASNRCVQLIDGGNDLYVELPTVQGPVDLTLYVGNAGAKAGTFVITDEKGDTKNPLASLDLPAAKKITKYVYKYPYKGDVKLRIYNMKNQINLNDILIQQGEGEGEEKPKDEKAPSLLYSWPSAAEYAPLAGTVTLIFDEDIVATGNATINGVACEANAEGKTLTISYSGLENGKVYEVTLPEVADEAGNKVENLAVTIKTAAEHVLYYSDFNSYPYEYWNKYYSMFNSGANSDIITKGTVTTVEIGGLKFVGTGSNGRVIAMNAKNNLTPAGETDNGASDYCVQLMEGGDGLYMELPEAEGPCTLTLYVGNPDEAAKEGITVTDGAATETTLATVNLPASKTMTKVVVPYTESGKVALRLYNNGNKINVNDVLITKGVDGTTVIAGLETEESVEAVYYNLSGMRVANPSNGIFIRVRGEKVDKVVIR